MMCIYLRTNKINGKQYVGQTVDFTKREYEWMTTISQCFVGSQHQLDYCNTNFHNAQQYRLTTQI